MIPKKSKYALTVTLLAPQHSLSRHRVQKKHDKIDLSGSQAAESTVQTAPVSTTAAESGPVHPSPSNQALKTRSPRELPPEVPPHPFPLSVKTDTYQNGNVSIQYPVISDNSVKPEINDHLKDNAPFHPESLGNR